MNFGEKLLVDNIKSQSMYALLKGALYSLSYKNYRPVFVSSSFV